MGKPWVSQPIPISVSVEICTPGLAETCGYPDRKTRNTVSTWQGGTAPSLSYRNKFLTQQGGRASCHIENQIRVGVVAIYL